MVTLIDRQFVSQEKGWDYLARLDLWPTWAPHIKYIATHSPSELGRLRFVLDASGAGVGFFGRVFARIYSRNLEKAIPLLVQAMETKYR